MKKIVAVLVVTLVIAMCFSGCGAEKLYYSYDMTDYLTVGEFSNNVSKASSDFKSVSTSYYESTFGDALDYQVDEGVVADGDTVNIDYTGYLNGEAFENGADTGYDLVIGSNSFIDGFEEGLIGATIGETTNLNLTFPTSYHATELAGKDVVFEVKVNYVTKQGELTDENIVRYGFASLDDFYKQQEEYAAKVCMFYNVYDATTFNDFPEREFDRLYEDTYSYYEQMCEANGFTVESLASANDMTLEEFEDYVAEYDVKDQMEFYLVAYYVLQENDQTLTDEDVSAKRAELIEQYGEDLSEVGYNEINIQQAAAYDKALKILAEQVELTD